MIVHPDFLDHAKTRAFIDLVGDTHAPFMVLRLWGYCQFQKKSVFESVPNLRVICRSSLPTETILAHLVEAGFVDRGQSNEFIVHDWEKCNRMLRSAWDNGKRGGQPTHKQQPTGSRQVSDRYPAGARVQKNRIEKVGYRPVGIENAPDQPTKDLASPTAEERAATHKRFSAICRETGEKLKAGTLKVAEETK